MLKKNVNLSSANLYGYSNFKCVHPYSNLPAYSGVYAMTLLYEEGGSYYHKLLYVGQATNIRNRLSGHEKLPCVEQYGFNSICTLRVDSANQRTIIEEHLICKAKPVCNDKIPSNC